MRPLDLDSTWTWVHVACGHPRFNTRNRAGFNWYKRACRRRAKKHWYRHENKIDRKNPW